MASGVLVTGGRARLGQWAKIGAKQQSGARAVLTLEYSLYMETSGDKTSVMAVLVAWHGFRIQEILNPGRHTCNKIDRISTNLDKIRYNLDLVQTKLDPI